MRDHRKPPAEHQATRHDGAPMPSPSDSGGFSIESTTVRLKSMRLRRAENEKREFEQLSTPKNPGAVDMSSDRPSGRVKHDERGVAVWDFAIATGEFASLSQTAALKKLSIGDLELEDHKPAPALKLEKAGRDKGGGFDPYNQRGSGKREGEAATRAGVTGSSDRERANVLDQLLGKKK